MSRISYGKCITVVSKRQIRKNILKRYYAKMSLHIHGTLHIRYIKSYQASLILRTVLFTFCTTCVTFTRVIDRLTKIISKPNCSNPRVNIIMI